MSTTPSESTEVAAPYGTGSASVTPPSPGRKVRVHHLRELKERGEPWPMLTAYDMYTAALFDEAGIPVLLVGDSAANNVFGYDTSLPVTVDELVPLVRAVTRSVKRALVVADLPFGSYQLSPEQALATSVRFMKEGRAHAVKLEGGRAFAPHVKAITTAGVPVMAHIGFTPQSEPTGPDHRHRSRAGLRRASPCLARHGGPAPGQGAALRQALRGHGRRAARRRPAVRHRRAGSRVPRPRARLPLIPSRQIRPGRHDAGRVDLLVGQVVVPLDVVEVDGLAEAGLPVEIAGIGPEDG